MKRPPSPSRDSSLGVPEFPEKSCQNNWNPHPGTKHLLNLDNIMGRDVDIETRANINHRKA